MGHRFNPFDLQTTKPMKTFDDDDWNSLLDQMANRHVLPVIGPGVVTVEQNGKQRPLYQALAQPLAAKLELKPPARPWRNTMDVAREAISSGTSAAQVWDKLKALLRQHTQPGPALQALAQIECFDLYIASTPDDLMVHALKGARPGFDESRQVFYFCDRGRASPHPACPEQKLATAQMQQFANCDLPSPLPALALYQVMSSLQAPNAPVWEEDYMEYICTLLEKAAAVENLHAQLKSRDLLLIGALSEDWLVRFFLRVARGKRLSEDGRNARHCLAEARKKHNEPMLFFFEQATRLTRIIDGDPVLFALELKRRWSQRATPVQSREDFFKRIGPQCPTGGVFVSYASEDIEYAETLGRALLTAGVPVWLDKRELESGGNYNSALGVEIKQYCCLFISVVSRTTEGPKSKGRYVHQEREWAALRHEDGYVFYLKLLVDLPEKYRDLREPPAVKHVHHHRFEYMEGFVKRVRELVDAHRVGQRLRG